MKNKNFNKLLGKTGKRGVSFPFPKSVYVQYFDPFVLKENTENGYIELIDQIGVVDKVPEPSRCFSFDGTNQGVVLSSGFNFEIGDTISMYLDLTNLNSGARNYFVGFSNNSGDAGIFYDSSTNEFGVEMGEALETLVSFSLPTEFVFIEITRTSSGVYLLFVNETEIGSMTTNTTETPIINSFGYKTNDLTGIFKGRIGIVQTKNSLGEYENQWLFDDNSGDTARNSIGSIDGTINNYDVDFFNENYEIPSYQNMFGFSEGTGDLKIPLKYTDNLRSLNQDVNGNKPTYFGQTKYNLKVLNSSLISPDGINDSILFNDLTGITVSSSEGTSTPSVSGNSINFTAGTCWNLLLSNGSFFALSEGDGVHVFDSVNGLIGEAQNVDVSTFRLNNGKHLSDSLTNGFNRVSRPYGDWINYVSDNLGLGDGDFYYRYFGAVDSPESPTSKYLFSNGLTGDGGIRSLLFCRTSQLLFNLDDNITSNSYVILDDGEIFHKDIVDFKITREGTGTNNCHWTCENITTGLSYEGHFTNNQDVSSTQPFYMFGVGAASNSFPIFYCLEAGTSSSNISTGIMPTSKNLIEDVVGGKKVSIVGDGDNYIYRLPKKQNTTKDIYGVEISNISGKWHNGAEVQFEQYHSYMVINSDRGINEDDEITDNQHYWFGELLESGDSLVVGKEYIIRSRKTLDFTLNGASDNNVGTKFTSTGTGTLGSGDVVVLAEFNATPVSVSYFERNFDTYELNPLHQIFSNAEEKKWRKIIMFKKALEEANIDKQYSSIVDKVSRDENNDPILDQDGNIIYKD